MALRVVVVSHLFPTSLGQVGLFVFRHVKALDGLGVETRVVQPVPWVPFVLRPWKRWNHYSIVSKEPPWGGVEASRIVYPNPPTGPLQWMAGLGLVSPLLLALRKLREEFRFDIIHAHCVTPDGFAAVVAGRALGVPIVVSARGSDIHTYPKRGGLARAEARFAIRGCDRLIAVSEALAGEATKLGAPRSPVEVLYNGVDTGLFGPSPEGHPARAALGLPMGGVTVLVVGALVREKGIGELVKVFERVGAEMPHVRLLVLGEGPMRRELEALAARLGASNRVLLPGAVPNERVAEYMRAADVFLHPSHAEGLPNVVLEAMATGLPVIASDVGGIPEVVVHGETGFLVAAGDVDDLELRLREVLADADLSRRMGAAGRRRVMKNHSWERNAQEHVRIYRTLLDR